MEIAVITTFTLVYCQPGKYPDVLAAAKKIPGVVSAFSVHGRCDVVIVAKLEKHEDLGMYALHLNAISGVNASETLVGFE
jgi:DNA-binding Lrp family transcriptional regulator